MLSAKESIDTGSSNRKVALYKGLKVAVYTVDKPEINLTRQDLIELVNVRILSVTLVVKLYYSALFTNNNSMHYEYYFYVCSACLVYFCATLCFCVCS